MTIIIRQERENDYAQVEKLVETAFAGQEYSEKDEHLLVHRLRQAPTFIPELSLVAEQDGQVAGHILFTPIQIVGPVRSVGSLTLAPVSVRPALQKQGIGSLLIREGLRWAKELGFASVIVLGHKDYYPKFGFAPAGKWGITSPSPGAGRSFFCPGTGTRRFGRGEGSSGIPAGFFLADHA